MTLRELEPVHPVETGDGAGADHPMRKVTRQVAFDGSWDSARAAKVADLFSSMASEWTESHDVAGRYLGLTDALQRGEVQPGRAVELGSGTGLGTRMLADHFDAVTALDLSREMLRNAPAEYGSRVQGDSACLPVRTGSVDALVLVNMLLFPAEVDRVLSASGQLVWFNTVGEQTPIHLSAADVLDALPGQWNGVASRAGRGTWLVARRA